MAEKEMFLNSYNEIKRFPRNFLDKKLSSTRTQDWESWTT